MRVITGTAKGRKLKDIPGRDIRPTSDMVKEALFSIVQFDVEGRRVLDLFAGTGQLGIEALSRGAHSAVFVDESTDAVRGIRENLKHCKLEGRVLQGDAVRYPGQGEKFDLIFVDPPYDTGLIDKTLQEIYRFDILTYGGIMVCESTRDKILPDMQSPYFKRKEYVYGKVKLTVYGREAG